ncbi:MAG: class SAM-dependent methyltransferase [Ignavibacteria bacterium]|nr:class SAM-dependent methyltransferase [Ignavibacteria bacterium]
MNKKQTFDLNDPETISAIDELPLWSAPFGLTLLETVKIRRNINILDIGSGLGFPLLELAGRFVDSCKLFGIDPWDAARERAIQKAKLYGLNNVTLIKAVAEEMPFEDDYFDLIMSNNGLNNVEDLEKSLSECRRTAKTGCQLVFTMNLPGSMSLFYEYFEKTLRHFGLDVRVDALQEHIFQKRKPVDFMIETVKKYNFEPVEIKENSFSLRFSDGTTLFNHFLIRIGFLPAWKKITPEEYSEKVFTELENSLNQYAELNGEISLNIPYACFDCLCTK